MSVLETKDLTMSYGSRRGIQNVSLQVESGQIFGFLGPNGAGKSTTIRILMGLLRASSGQARIFGLDCWHYGDRIRRDVGYVAGDVRLYPWLTLNRGLKIVSGGTDNHLMLVDLIAKGITGKLADATLGRAHITVNKNSVPNDPRSPFVTSGLRLGSPASTTRGFKEAEMAQIAGWIADIVDAMSAAGDVDGVIARVAGDVAKLTARFPVYAA